MSGGRLSSGVIVATVLITLLVTTYLLYQPGLVNLWVFDDHPNLGPLVDDLHAGRTAGDLFDSHLVSGSGPTGRPVSMLTFILDGLARGPTLDGWKTTSLIIHLACGILVFLVVSQLQRLFDDAHRSCSLPLLVSAVWLLHPLHVSTVLYTVQRMALLSTMFQLMGLYAYLHARAAYLVSDTPKVVGWLAGAVASLLLGIFSKENGILLVTYIVLVELLKPGLNHREARWSMGVLFAVLGGAVAVGVAWSMLHSGSFFGGYSTRFFTLEERLLTQPRILLEYVYMTLVPSLAEMKFIHDDLEISRGLFSPWATVVAIAALLAFASSAWVQRRKRPLFTYGAGLFFCGHLLESSVVPLDLMYEHRQYFPSIGLILSISALCIPLLTRRGLAVITFLPLLVLLSMMTWMRAVTWSSEAKLYAEMMRINPDSPRAMTMVANWFGNRGETKTARTLLARIDSPAAQLNVLYYNCIEGGELLDEDLDSLPEPDIVSFYESSGLMYLGRAGLAGSCRFPDEAYLGLLDRWMQRPVHGKRSGLLIYRGYYLSRSGRHEDAIAALEQAFRAGGARQPVALVIAAELSIDAGELVWAERLLERARFAIGDGATDPDIEMASERLRVARQRPDELVPFDPFKE
jgi:hypothetical protein